MNDSSPVGRVQGAAELRREPTHLRRRQRTGARQSIGQIAARVEVHHQKQELLGRDDVMNPDDVRVLDPPDDLCFAREPTRDDPIPTQVRVQDLDRHVDPAHLVARGEHPSDAPLPELAQHPVPPVEQPGQPLDPSWGRPRHQRHPPPSLQPTTVVG